MPEAAKVDPGPIAGAHLQRVIQRLRPGPEAVCTKAALWNDVVVDQHPPLCECLGKVRHVTHTVHSRILPLRPVYTRRGAIIWAWEYEAVVGNAGPRGPKADFRGDGSPGGKFGSSATGPVALIRAIKNLFLSAAGCSGARPPLL